MLSPSLRSLCIIVTALSLSASLFEYNNRIPVATFPPLNVPSSERLKIPQPRHLGLPMDMLNDATGRIFIADAFNDQILAFDSYGRLESKIGRLGQAKGEFNYPIALQYLKNHRLAVMDAYNGRVQILTTSGHSLSEILVKSNLGGLAIFPDGSTYCFWNGPIGTSKPVFIIYGFQQNGSKLTSWRMSSPIVKLQPETHGNLWVLTTNGLILYSRQGRIIKRLALPKITEQSSKSSGSSWLTNEGETESISKYSPTNMCQSYDGKVYIASWDYVLIYNKDYEPLAYIPAKSLTGKPLKSITVDLKDNLWVADDHRSLARVKLSRGLSSLIRE